MNMTEKALQIAVVAHGGQTRKGDGSPMITHPIEVANTLREAGFSDELVAAGYLHDTVEDTEVTFEYLHKEFDAKVVYYVAGNTEDKTKSWEERKQKTIDTVGSDELEIRALIVSDKLSNFRSLMKDYATHGEALWSVFNRGKEKQQWYFESIAKNMTKGLEPSQIPAFFTEYATLVEVFFNRINLTK